MVKTLIICVDGLGFDMMNKENSPFLFEFAKKNNLSKLKSFFAFTGIEHSFLSGKTPAESGIWIEFSREKSIFNSWLLRSFSWNKKLRDYCAVFLELMHKRGWLSGLHNIPNKFLKYFDTSLKKGLWELELFNKKNFVLYKWPFYVVRENEKIKKKIIFKNETDENKLNRILSENTEIYYTQLLGVDKAMHKFGKYSKESKRSIREMDNLLGKKIPEFIAKNPDAKIILWSDHGFSDIKTEINIQEKLPKRNDYIYFLGGTTISFWFMNKKVEGEVLEALKKFKEIKILDDKIAEKYSIPVSEKNGQLVGYLEKGNYFFPNFYQKEKNEKFVSMHGYPEDDDFNGFIASNFKIKKELKQNEVLNEIKWLL